MTSVKPRTRPYTSVLVKNPTYPMIIQGTHTIREMPWPEDVLRIYSLVRTTSSEEAIKMAPPPWRRYPADIRAELAS